MRVGIKIIVTIFFAVAFLYIGLNMMNGIGVQVTSGIVK